MKYTFQIFSCAEDASVEVGRNTSARWVEKHTNVIVARALRQNYLFTPTIQDM